MTGTDNFYEVVMVNGFGRRGLLQTDLPDSVFVQDEVPPAAPTGFAAVLAGGTAMLSWGDSTEEDLAGFERDLEEALVFGPEHVSTYELSIEPGTPFATAAARGQLRRAAEEEIVAMVEAAEARLEAAGFERYELSNFARPGFAAVHNRRYWERRPVLGLGVGAFSTDPAREGAPFGVRRANSRDLKRYLDAALAGRWAEAEPPEVLDAPTARGEAMFLALRSAVGLDARRFASEFGRFPRGFWEEAIAELVARGLLEEQLGGDLRLTRRGRLLSDSVFEHFV